MKAATTILAIVLMAIYVIGRYTYHFGGVLYAFLIGAIVLLIIRVIAFRQRVK